MCRSYQATEQEQEILISTTQRDIDEEKENAIAEDRLEGIPMRAFSDGYL